MAYISQKQLGGILRIDDITTAGNVIGTASEIAQSRALYFNQETASISVDLTDPLPSTPKQLVIINRGTESITVEGNEIKPGPAYGLYWTGDSWTPVQVEGVGTVSNLEESRSVELSGNGSPIDPLTAVVKLSSDVNNALEIHNDGLYTRVVNAGAGTLAVVDRATGDDTYTGSDAGTLKAPWKTIQHALNNVVNNTTVLVMAGTYNENLILPSNISIILYSFSVNDSSPVKITGNITNQTGMRRIRFNGFQIQGKTGTPTITFTGSTGSVVFDNCSIEHVDGADAEAVTFGVGNTGWYSFINGSITGRVTVPSNNSAIALYLTYGSAAFKTYAQNANSTVVIGNMGTIGPIVHSGGSLIINSVLQVTPDGSNVSIQSTAATGLLSLTNVSLLQNNGTFGEFIKTGACVFALAGLYRDPLTNDDGFSGPQILMNTAVDIHASYATPTAYTPVDTTVRGHLEGINAALAAESGGLSAVEHQNTDTIEFSGSGRPDLPLVANVKVSSASGNAISSNSDGIYAAVTDVGLESVEHQNTDTIDITGSGTTGDPLQAEVSLSSDPKNALTKDADGLLVIIPPSNFDIAFNISYNWLANDTLFAYRATQDYTLAQNLGGSYLYVDNGGNTMNSDVVIKKNLTEIGRITFDSNLSVGYSITFSAEATFSIGDILSFTALDEEVFNIVSFSILALRTI